MRCKLTPSYSILLLLFLLFFSFFLFYKLFVASVSYLSCDIARKPGTFITEKKKGVEKHTGKEIFKRGRKNKRKNELFDGQGKNGRIGI